MHACTAPAVAACGLSDGGEREKQTGVLLLCDRSNSHVCIADECGGGWTRMPPSETCNTADVNRSETRCSKGEQIEQSGLDREATARGMKGREGRRFFVQPRKMRIYE
ncbi:uncharacterized protein LOC124410756 [Diprion similis]|uniref:uncharacterized protein LOC124410756 n=1 Tax=Diprion similis TaxID=362088 RepID=UPI001EF8F64B|nr:uncharacterized protein LOC124410756 [Diprion similis]